MYAVELEATIRNGAVYIPLEYLDLLQAKKAKFIVMFDKEPISDIGHKSSEIDTIFDKFQVDFSSFKFDRDEANER